MMDYYIIDIRDSNDLNIPRWTTYDNTLGIKLLVSCDGEKESIFSVAFDKELWTKKSAVDWVKNHIKNTPNYICRDCKSLFYSKHKMDTCEICGGKLKKLNIPFIGISGDEGIYYPFKATKTAIKINSWEYISDNALTHIIDKQWELPLYLDTKSLKPGWYSERKPYYRFMWSTVYDEMKKIGWDNKRVLIDTKADGLRMSVGKINGKGFAYVDPDDVKDKSPNVSNRIPGIINELEKILPDNTILDGEFLSIHPDGKQMLHRTITNSLLNSNVSGEELENYAIIWCFDVVYWKGLNVEKLPLKERLEFLQQIKPSKHIWIDKFSTSLNSSADSYIVDGGNKKEVEKARENIVNNKSKRPKFFTSEGIMIKTLDGTRTESQVKSWAKAKLLHEVDFRIVDKKNVKGSDDTFNYKLAIDINHDYAKSLLSFTTKDWYGSVGTLKNNKLITGKECREYLDDNNTKFFMITGKSDNTNAKLDINSIARFACEEVLRYDNEKDPQFPRYGTYICTFLEPVPEKNVSDSPHVLYKLSNLEPMRIPIDKLKQISETLNDLKSSNGEEVIHGKPITQGYEILDGKRVGWYRWGEHGKKYYYTPGNKKEREWAYNKAWDQGKAIHARQNVFKSKTKFTKEFVWDLVKNKHKIPEEIYDELAEDLKPLPDIFYVDRKDTKNGKLNAFAQLHFRGIEPEKYKAFKEGKIKLWEALVGQSVHSDIRLNFEGLPKWVQIVITEDSIQNMIKTFKGEKRKTKDGVMNVAHSMAVSKPSGEPPSEYMFKSKLKEPSIDEEGAKLAESLDIGRKNGLSFWIEPNSIGSTKYTYSYMMLIWTGKVSEGVTREDFKEYFFYKEKANDDLLNGKFNIRWFKDSDGRTHYEFWKSTNEKKPLDPILHSDLGAHWLIPSKSVKHNGKDENRKESIKRYKESLGM